MLFLASNEKFYHRLSRKQEEYTVEWQVDAGRKKVNETHSVQRSKNMKDGQLPIRSISRRQPSHNCANDAEDGSQGQSTMFAEGSPSVDWKAMLQRDEVESVLWGVQNHHQLFRSFRMFSEYSRTLLNDLEFNVVF